MKFELPELPCAIGNLEPHLTEKTLEFQFDRHHRGWHSMAPDGGGQPSGRIDQAIVRVLGMIQQGSL